MLTFAQTIYTNYRQKVASTLCSSQFVKIVVLVSGKMSLLNKMNIFIPKPSLKGHKKFYTYLAPKFYNTLPHERQKCENRIKFLNFLQKSYCYKMILKFFVQKFKFNKLNRS